MSLLGVLSIFQIYLLAPDFPRFSPSSSPISDLLVLPKRSHGFLTTQSRGYLLHRSCQGSGSIVVASHLRGSGTRNNLLEFLRCARRRGQDGYEVGVYLRPLCFEIFWKV